MKKFLYYSFILCSIIAFSSCSKDEEKDPCDDIICQNGGLCNGSSCDCPINYTGVRCESQKTPTQIVIDSLVLTGWPGTDNGISWDPGSDPDIFLEISQGNNLVHTTGVITDADNTAQYFYNTPIAINSPISSHNFRLYDEDALGSDYVDGGTFTLYRSTNKFPKILGLTLTNNSKIDLYVSYKY